MSRSSPGEVEPILKSTGSIHHRRSIRLPGYDYSQPGAYFVTLVTHGRECLFGAVVDGEMRLNDAGRIVAAVWASLPARYPGVRSGASVVMPNHFHGVVEIYEIEGHSRSLVGAIHELPQRELPQQELPQRENSPEQRHLMTLPLVIGYFKRNTAKQINTFRQTPGTPVWQRNYYEHILRDEDEYRRIFQYILGNPGNWADDDENR